MPERAQVSIVDYSGRKCQGDIPTNVTVRQILPYLVRELKLPVEGMGGTPIKYYLMLETNEGTVRLDEEAILAETGVQDGVVLVVLRITSKIQHDEIGNGPNPVTKKEYLPELPDDNHFNEPLDVDQWISPISDKILSKTGGQDSTEKTLSPYKVALPDFAFLDYPVDVALLIYRDSVRYGLDIHAEYQKQRFSIDMSLHDLQALSKEFQQEMQTITRENSDEEPSTVEVVEKNLRPLAEIGHYAFKKIFSDQTAEAAIKSLMILSRYLCFEINTEEFFLPWELLYDVSLEEPLSFENFWGMKYVITRTIVRKDRRSFSPIIRFENAPTVGLLTYRGLPHVTKIEIPFFEELERTCKIKLSKLDSLNPDQKEVDNEYGKLKKFLQEPHNLLHFACHAFYNDKFPASSHILLSEEFSIFLRNMVAYKISINGPPLIIMNACETGNINPLYTSYFAAEFLNYGALGVVATECAVNDAFAADFTQQLYPHLLQGKPLGESLLLTRRFFLEKYQNPSGLLYSMYAPPSTRLLKQ